MLDDAVDLALAVRAGATSARRSAPLPISSMRSPEEAFDQPAVLGALGIVVRAAGPRRRLLAPSFRRGAPVRAPSVRRSYYVVDLMVAIVRGADRGRRDRARTASTSSTTSTSATGCSPTARSARRSIARWSAGIVYDLGFAYEGGDPQRPSCAAGTALRGLLRAFFTYRGSLMWRMNSGMGDVVFLPFYELLIKRGVKVRFFHRVEELTAANGVVERDQDRRPSQRPTEHPAGGLRDGRHHQAAGRRSSPGRGNPSAILDGAGHPAEDYESWYSGRSAAQVETKVLSRGADDGFDLVVFGLPISCVPYVAPDLVESSPRWKAAVDYLRTVPTQAMQLWLEQPASLLADVDDGIVVSGYVEPFDTWADMSQLPPQERVTGSATVAYFCNVLADAPPPARGEDADSGSRTRRPWCVPRRSGS